MFKHVGPLLLILVFSAASLQAHPDAGDLLDASSDRELGSLPESEFILANMDAASFDAVRLHEDIEFS
jgi:hypothetical protein